MASTAANQTQGAIPPGTAGDTASSLVFATTDPAQAYVGTVPPRNTFTPLGQVNPDYVRSDSLVLASNSFSTVAEGFLTPPSTSSAPGSYSVSAVITLTTATTLTLAGTVTNTLNVIFNGNNFGGGGQATAGNTFVFGVTNRSTGVTTDFAPTLLNGSITLTANGNASLTNPATQFSIVTGQLAGTYDLSLQSSSRVFLTQAVVPEPASVALLGCGLVTVVSLAARRAAASRRPSPDSQAR